MKIELISIGSEVLSGHTVNTNAAFLSRRLSRLGYTVSRHTVISDDAEEIRQGCRDAMKRAPLVITTGGLGPTIDDVTKKALGSLFETSTPLPNRIGTASGIFFPNLIALPGVAREMEAMFEEEAIALIQKHFPLEAPRFRVGCYLCLLKEIEVNPYLIELQKKHPDVEMGIYPSQGFLFVEFSGFLESRLQDMASALRKKFLTFYVGSQPVVQAVHQECISRKKTLALAESCSGGAIAAALTMLPDASLYFLGSLVVYSNAWKERFLQVSRSTLTGSGAVSKETVEEMVQGLFQESDADFAIAISGILGPSGGSPQKPVGTIYIAIGERGQKTDVGRLKTPLDRKSAIDWTVQTALGALWRRLVHGAFTFS